MSLAFTAAAAPGPSRRLPKWTPERVARLKNLIELGLRPEVIAKDPLINTTAESVSRKARRLRIAFAPSDRPAFSTIANDAAAKASSKAYIHFDAAARKRGLSRVALARRLLREIAADPVLIENVLDDGM